MALEAAILPIPRVPTLSGAVCDSLCSSNCSVLPDSCSSNDTELRGSTVTFEVRFEDERTGSVRPASGVYNYNHDLEPLRSRISNERIGDCSDPDFGKTKKPAKTSSRHKNKKNRKVALKSAEKVHPELVDIDSTQGRVWASAEGDTKVNMTNKGMDSVKSLKIDCSPAIIPPLTSYYPNGEFSEAIMLEHNWKPPRSYCSRRSHGCGHKEGDSMTMCILEAEDSTVCGGANVGNHAEFLNMKHVYVREPSGKASSSKFIKKPHNPYDQNRKDFRHISLQKHKKSVKSIENYKEKKPYQDHVTPVDVLVERHLISNGQFAGDDLSGISLSSNSGQNKSVIGKPKNEVLADSNFESSLFCNQYNAEPNQCVSQSTDSARSMKSGLVGKSQARRSPSKHKKGTSSRRDVQSRGVDSYSMFNATVPSKRIFFQQYCPCATSCFEKGLGDCMKIPRTKTVETRSLQNFISYNIRCKQDSGYRPKRWVPICKDTNTLKPAKSVENQNNYCDVTSASCNVDKFILLDGTDISSQWLTTNTHSGGGTFMSNHEGTPLVKEVSKFDCIKSKLEVQKVHNNDLPLISAPEGFGQLFISLMAKQAFSSSHSLQLASEDLQRAAGHPLAEFERLLNSATPIFASPVACQDCNDSLVKKMGSTCSSRHTLQGISLSAVWSWYEQPGNYGLKVTVDDCSGYFDAHFVPSLSAIQLFGYDNESPSSCQSNKLSHLGPGDLKLNSSDDNLVIATFPESTHMNCLQDQGGRVKSKPLIHFGGSSEVGLNSANDDLGVHSPVSWGDAEPMFEYFEFEQPHQRMPLYDKIMDLVAAGGSKNNGVGDPSKLECAKLHDLHPASWFSVAWYPIYRIPEGQFRAAFLTYHSLGCLVHSSATFESLKKDTVCVALPVIGLQSYNAQSEVWFKSKLQTGSPLRELSSEVLKERMKTLEENALLFARGLVCKNHTVVANRHQDYEFFVSRKC